MVYKPIYLEWMDAFHSVGWKSKELALSEELCLVKTLGFLLEETDNGYYVALSVALGEDNDNNARMFIPKGMVKKKKFIKL